MEKLKGDILIKYGPWGIVVLVLLALGVGVYLGYAPEQVLNWLGL